MKTKLIPFILVLVITIGSVIFSCMMKKQTISFNISQSPDGNVYTMRKMAEITKVVAFDPMDRSRMMEYPSDSFSYNAETTEITFKQKSDGKTDYVIEGKPEQPAAFVLCDLDVSAGPVFVFFDNSVAAENSDYMLDTHTKTLVFREDLNPDAVPHVIAWQTSYGMSSIVERIDEIESMYLKANAIWLADLIRRDIEKQTQNPDIVIENGIAHIVMKPLSEEEKQRMIDEIPVMQVKPRPKVSLRKVSKEVGFSVAYPETVEVGNIMWKTFGPLVIENTVKGSTIRTVELYYQENGDPESESLVVTLSAVKNDEKLQWEIETSVLDFEIPITKRTAYAITQLQPSEEKYTASKYCYYSWSLKGIQYQMSAEESESEKVEQFIKAFVSK